MYLASGYGFPIGVGNDRLAVAYLIVKDFADTDRPLAPAWKAGELVQIKFAFHNYKTRSRAFFGIESGIF